MSSPGAETLQARGPGRPRKVKTETITKQEYVDDSAEHGDSSKEDGSFAGLFDEALDRSVVKVRVTRKDPNEGILGYLEDPAMGEDEIRERWGGSLYMVQGVDARGRTIKGNTIKVSGDPIFQSLSAEMSWKRSKGIAPTVAAVAAAAPENGIKIQDILMIMQTQDEKRRAEEREHQERMRRLELESREKERRDDEERERRRAKDDEEREARRRREQAESDARSQQFMATTIQMLQQSNQQALQFVKAEQHANGGGNNLMDAVKTVVAIKEAFAGEGGEGGEETVLQTLIKHGGEWVNGLGNGIVGAIREVKQGGVSGTAPGVAVPGRAPTVSPVPATSPLALLPVGHPLNNKVETLVAKLAAKGLDPLAALDTIVGNVLVDVDRIPQQGKPVTVAPTNRPYVQDPVGVAKVASDQPVTEEPAKVIRLSFGKR